MAGIGRTKFVVRDDKPQLFHRNCARFQTMSPVYFEKLQQRKIHLCLRFPQTL
jgi:hypothetical protein